VGSILSGQSIMTAKRYLVQFDLSMFLVINLRGFSSDWSSRAMQSPSIARLSTHIVLNKTSKCSHRNNPETEHRLASQLESIQIKGVIQGSAVISFFGESARTHLISKTY
jgi:hypothetical protein